MPTFAKELRDHTLVCGKPLKLEVVVNGIPKPTVHWFKDDQPLEEKDISFESKDKTHCIFTSESNPAHAGMFKAVAQNEAGTTESICCVGIQTKPMISKPKDVKLISGDEFSIPLTIDGTPEPMIKLMKDKKELPASLGISMEKKDNTYIMYLKECTKDLNGTFSVTATNPAGSDTISFKVVVLGKFRKKFQNHSLLF